MHTLDTTTAGSLDIPPRGALLLRPDGHALARASTPDKPLGVPSWLTPA